MCPKIREKSSLKNVQRAYVFLPRLMANETTLKVSTAFAPFAEFDYVVKGRDKRPKKPNFHETSIVDNFERIK